MCSDMLRSNRYVSIAGDQLSGGASELAGECIYWMEIDLILRMENDMQILI